ncbi:hypothetical protein FACS1894207_3910 [Bacteroidia bacterium]|nr:hypothetical protein FACS1894207_3910 [Bacteroidia bacterium]
MKNIISIVGVQAELIPIPKNGLKGLNADMLLRFFYYTTSFHNQAVCVVRAKNGEICTPLKYKRISEQIEKVVGMPVVFLLDGIAYYERERLINQGVYFIVSDKYAFLPSLIVNVLAKEKGKPTTKLSPAAQYILLYYLLAENEKEFIIRDMQEIMPYNYLALSRAVINLEDCKLCQTEKDSTGTKIIRFACSKRELWEKAQKYLSSPVKKVLYSDVRPDEKFSISGVNALSHYSHLNPEQFGSVAVWDKLFQSSPIIYNEIEGNYRIEVWKYPATMPCQSEGNLVDKLSLYLSMKDETDARIEKELQILIENMKW